MTPDLDALAALLAAATPGPWVGTRWLHEYGYGYFHTLRPDQRQGITTNDALLIDAAVNALPDLIAAARRDARPRWHHDWDLPPEDRHYCEECASLIEAARREAGLREALRNLVEEWDADESAIDAVEQCFTEARALLHDNAGATEPAEGTE